MPKSKYKPAEPLDRYESIQKALESEEVRGANYTNLNQVWDEGRAYGEQCGMALALVRLKQGWTKSEIIGDHPKKEEILKSLKGETA
tara:strand:- start:231 stop:491 length:261 start_codon:yes stop_codon:yes gene_type:complete